MGSVHKPTILAGKYHALGSISWLMAGNAAFGKISLWRYGNTVSKITRFEKRYHLLEIPFKPGDTLATSFTCPMIDKTLSNNHNPTNQLRTALVSALPAPPTASLPALQLVVVINP